MDRSEQHNVCAPLRRCANMIQLPPARGLAEYAP
jgi:hypothetical protein